MIEFGFRSPSKNEIGLEKEQQLKKMGLDRFGDFKKEFESAETYIDYNVDDDKYTLSCKKDFSDLMIRFQQYEIEKNQSSSNSISPSDNLTP